MLDCIETIHRLVTQFKADQLRYCSSTKGYTETETRIEFIDPLFSCLGWDMSNTEGLSNSLKDVIREESQATETISRRPDYTFRINAVRKFFVEAKKPAVDIKKSQSSAFQVRSYGWTAGMSVSILTNFRTLRVYDTSVAPSQGDNADVGLLLEIDFEDLIARFGELKNIFGRDSIAQGSIEEYYGSPDSVSLPIGPLFLNNFNDWRLKIASDIYGRHPEVEIDTLNDISQKLINRMIFIRMCEDRGIEGESRLKKAASTMNFLDLHKMFQEMDERYNTGLFDLKRNPFELQYSLDSKLFLQIVEELYYPKAPYSFSVLNADFLGEVYERFLSKRLFMDNKGRITLEDKLTYEDREVVTTPQPLVDEIVRRAFDGRFNNLQMEGDLSFEVLKSLKVIDIAVGSSRFLLRCLDQLVDAAIKHFIDIGDKRMVYEKSKSEYRLTFEAKKELLLNCLFGIDIDYNAVEIARFSLLVKLLEDENSQTIPSGKGILPNLNKNIVWGNSVVSSDFESIDETTEQHTHPIDWKEVGLPEHFDIIVGNPPYVKTEEMKVKTKEEFEYYKKTYVTPFRQFDKYFIFVEKSIQQLKPEGIMGILIPNKWMNIESGAKLRKYLASEKLVSEIVNFGTEKLFDGKSAYVCILVASRSCVAKQSFQYNDIKNYSSWLTDPSNKGMQLPYDILTNVDESPWVLPANEKEADILSFLISNSVKLEDIATVTNGIQTSAEEVFSIENWVEDGDYIEFKKGEMSWLIEKAITKPYLMDSTKVKSYKYVQADALIIFPYENDNGKVQLVPINILQTKYPKAWAYLEHFKNRLLRRATNPKLTATDFYRYGRNQALMTASSSPKILYSVNQLGNKYGIDVTGIVYASGGTAGEVSISAPLYGYSLEFILGLLNQRVAEFYMRKRGSPFGGGYYSRGSAVTSDLPVPNLDFNNPEHYKKHSDITQLVGDLIVKRNGLETFTGRRRESVVQDIIRLEATIERQFDQLWSLQEGELKSSLPVKLSIL